MNTPGFNNRCLPIPRLEPSFLVPAEFEKLRWGIAGRGKRSGMRVIYYLRTRQGQIWMLTLYPKNVAENIPAHVLKQIKDEIDG